MQFIWFTKVLAVAPLFGSRLCRRSPYRYRHALALWTTPFSPPLQPRLSLPFSKAPPLKSVKFSCVPQSFLPKIAATDLIHRFTYTQYTHGSALSLHSMVFPAVPLKKVNGCLVLPQRRTPRRRVLQQSPIQTYCGP